MEAAAREGRGEAVRLLGQQAIARLGPRQAALDPLAHDPPQALHRGEHLALGEPTASALVLEGEVGQRRRPQVVLLRQLPRVQERDGEVRTGRHGEHGLEAPHEIRRGAGQLEALLALENQQDVAPRLDDLVSEHLLGCRWEVPTSDQRHVGVPSQADREPVDLDDLDHAASGREGDQARLAVRPARRQAVGVGVRIPEVSRPHLDGDALLREEALAIGDARVIGVPSQQPRVHAEGGALALVGRGEGAPRVELDEHLPQVASRELPQEPPDPDRGRGVRARRPAHDRPHHVVEDARGQRTREASGSGRGAHAAMVAAAAPGPRGWDPPGAW